MYMWVYYWWAMSLIGGYKWALKFCQIGWSRSRWMERFSEKPIKRKKYDIYYWICRKHVLMSKTKEPTSFLEAQM